MAHKTRWNAASFIVYPDLFSRETVMTHIPGIAVNYTAKAGIFENE
jgi:hypothetical protein